MNLNPARKELEIAKKSLFQMQLTDDFEKLEDLWRDVLNRLERCYDKAKDACHEIPKFKSWIGNYESLRKKDPLLSYLKQARNADTHSIKEIIVRKEHTQRQVFQKEQEILLADGVISELSQDMWEYYPKRIELINITNRGVVYSPPQYHRGKSTNPKNVEWNGHLGIMFYEEFLRNLEGFLQDQKT